MSKVTASVLSLEAGLYFSILPHNKKAVSPHIGFTAFVRNERMKELVSEGTIYHHSVPHIG